MAIQTIVKMRLLTVRPYNHKDSTGKSTGKLKGFIAEFVSVETDPLKTEVIKVFPTLDILTSDKIFESSKVNDMYQLAFEGSLSCSPRLVLIDKIK